MGQKMTLTYELGDIKSRISTDLNKNERGSSRLRQEDHVCEAGLGHKANRQTDRHLGLATPLI